MMERTVAIIGSGSREHALAGSFRKDSPGVGDIYMFGGNGGTEGVSDTHNIGVIDLSDNNEILQAVRDLHITNVVIGQERYLFQGLPDVLRTKGIETFGPGKQGAMLEKSKAFACYFNREFNILQPPFAVHSDYEQASKFLKNPPDWVKNGIAVKADGPAEGKGVYICNTQEEAQIAIRELIVDQRFDNSGTTVVFQQLLKEGYEVSAIAITDGKHFRLLPLVKDYKRLLDGDRGPNTGSMGVVLPHPYDSPALRRKIRNIFSQAISGLKKRKIEYNGALYAGLYVAGGKPYIIEYNARLGGGETEVQVPLVDEDLHQSIESVSRSRLENSNDIKVKDGAAVGVKLVSDGYPGKDFRKGQVIYGLDTVAKNSNIEIFQSGTARNNKGELVVSSGGVMVVVGLAKAPYDARLEVDKVIGQNEIHFDGMRYRKDIGFI